jgi:NADP-dependent 3-hydroxy acid dehydrogenase YdfG
VTDRDSVVAAADGVQHELGGADIVVNNAGVMLTAPFGSDQREEHRRMIETNLLGAMTTTEVFLDQLRAAHGGDLVNISSVAGRIAPAGFAAYAATKWGINGWSEALRLELQPDIRVTVIEPGAITTELTDHITDPASKRANKTATAEMGIPAHDIADVTAFAVSRPQRVTSTRSSYAPPPRPCEPNPDDDAHLTRIARGYCWDDQRKRAAAPNHAEAGYCVEAQRAATTCRVARSQANAKAPSATRRPSGAPLRYVEGSSERRVAVHPPGRRRATVCSCRRGPDGSPFARQGVPRHRRQSRPWVRGG